jgi:hypothetical protein
VAVELVFRHRGQLDAGVEHQQRHQRVAGRRGIADVAADGAGIADLVAGEVVAGLDQHRQVLAHQRMLHDLGDGASAPMRISLPSSVMPVSCGMWRMFISVCLNLMRPAWLCGVRSVPPASIVTLPPLRHSTAWSRLVGAK